MIKSVKFTKSLKSQSIIPEFGKRKFNNNLIENNNEDNVKKSKLCENKNDDSLTKELIFDIKFDINDIINSDKSNNNSNYTTEELNFDILIFNFLKIKFQNLMLH
ncbi:unnamed protein product [Rhizophagus irregularis]|nr:unnamed protein product [Rhizophagus irregularis]